MISIKTAIPGPNSKTLMEARETHVARGPFHATPIFAKKAHGALIEDVDGNVLIDFASGIGVVNVGHTPTEVVTAIEEQSKLLLHGSFNVTAYEGYVRLCEKLNQHTPGSFKKKSFLANSGAEAVENAIKIARAYTKRKSIIAFEHAYHGRTYMAMALTAKDKPYKEGFAPFPQHVYQAPFPYLYRWPTTSDEARVCEEAFIEFEKITKKVGTDDIAAVIIEPVLGEGGFLPAPKPFLSRLQSFCQTHGIVFIADEIQSGFGRTGTLFASEQLGITPDLFLTAKGLGAGLPIAGVTGRAEMMDAPQIGGIGGTYGGNPIACASALAVFKLFETSHILKKAKTLGEILTHTLNQWKSMSPYIGDVRGLGPMQGMEFVKDKKTKDPFPDATKKIIRFCYENGVVILNAGTYGNVIRFLIPLVIEESDLQEGLKVVERAIQSL